MFLPLGVRWTRPTHSNPTHPTPRSCPLLAARDTGECWSAYENRQRLLQEMDNWVGTAPSLDYDTENLDAYKELEGECEGEGEGEGQDDIIWWRADDALVPFDSIRFHSTHSIRPRLPTAHQL